MGGGESLILFEGFKRTRGPAFCLPDSLSLSLSLFVFFSFFQAGSFKARFPFIAASRARAAALFTHFQ